LSPYLSGNFGVYKCPADNYLSPPQRALNYPGRVRSLSMNSFFGPYSTNPRDPWGSGQNEFDTTYRQWTKLSMVAKPSDRFLFIDEQGDSINDGYFLNNPAGYGGNHWGDIPSNYHCGACGLSFADGHSEMHKWRSPWCIPPILYGTPNPRNFDAGGQFDYRWLMDRTAVLLPGT